MMLEIKDASVVEIDGEKYQVVGKIHSPSRGEEYQLSKWDGKIHRVCYAVPAGCKVLTNGQHIQGFAE